MEVAVQACDLDHGRVDGTRVYLAQLLRYFGRIAPETLFTLYHSAEWNPLLAPPESPNYQERRLPKRFAWMQTSFAQALFRDRPDKLFLPVQAAPLFLPRGLEVTVTIHDLAFKKFPGTFPWSDRLRLELMLRAATRRADKVIAISEATRRDLLAYCPWLIPEKIRVIHHGFDREFFTEPFEPGELSRRLAAFSLHSREYLLFVGALQPRKNLIRLVRTFERLRERMPGLKLVLSGERAWLSDPILRAVEKSPARESIVLTGKVSFETLRDLYRGARAFVFPSLYEGFGLPLLEAFAARVPVVTADNSSLREVAGDGALYCDAEDERSLYDALMLLLNNPAVERELLENAERVLSGFSWSKTAEQTLEYILSDQ